MVKAETSDAFVAALRAVLRGRRVLSRHIRSGRPQELPRRRRHPGPLLGARAGEVIRPVAEGLAMKEIGARLGITPRTVAFHKYRAMVKLGIGSSVGLVRFAIEAGLVRDRPVVRALAVGLGAEA